MILDIKITDRLNIEFYNKGEGENEKDSRTICHGCFYLYFSH
jgi:hypothetical protein